MKKILLYGIFIFLSFQLIQIDKENPSVDKKIDYNRVTYASPEIQKILKKACYDCHSNEVNYPWYSSIAPISWFIKEHVNQGKEYVNFSEYGKYNRYQKEHINSSLYRVIENKTMPLNSYLWMHKDANLSEKDYILLLNWFRTQCSIKN
ncbi:heme-binding domain-containing protein [Apibacter sp. B3706]|uniref:heme-binding domain-containing protein n=1 Tax=Apibacter sp. B3706 TaxID=2656760 RepID=UPI00140E2034|nr:heme-binding domain-containing protein [Apibacter sp. B3706]QII69712.1 heme-binding domain-containing protein [Apibacter sp. B3706]